MVGFLVTYNRRTGAGQVEEFGGLDGPRRAFERRLQLESERQNPDIEIAALSSDSLDTLKVTHSRYFSRGLHTA